MIDKPPTDAHKLAVTVELLRKAESQVATLTADKRALVEQAAYYKRQTDTLTAELSKAEVYRVRAETDLATEKAAREAAEASHPKCAVCGKLASCMGSYESDDAWDYACDECCGHGNEDGHCYPLAQVPAQYHANLKWLHDQQERADVADAELAAERTAHEAPRAQLQDMTQQWQKLATTTSDLRAKLERVRKMAECGAVSADAVLTLLASDTPTPEPPALLHVCGNCGHHAYWSEVTAPSPEPPALTEARTVIGMLVNAHGPYAVGAGNAWLAAHPAPGGEKANGT